MAGADRVGEPVESMDRRAWFPAAGLLLGSMVVLLGSGYAPMPVETESPFAETAPAESVRLNLSASLGETSSTIASEAAPQTGEGVLQREPPREPLSKLSLALPPKPKAPKDWDGSTLFRPVAVGSAMVEAMGRRVSIANTESIAPETTCLFEGRDWACGIHARTAFRMWLRGRALVCALPGETEKTMIAAPCRIGKQDAGAWLVANGWARAATGGPYADAQKSAEAAHKGIFGPPPSTAGIAPEPDAAVSTSVDQPVLSQSEPGSP